MEYSVTVQYTIGTGDYRDHVGYVYVPYRIGDNLSGFKEKAMAVIRDQRGVSVPDNHMELYRFMHPLLRDRDYSRGTITQHFDSYMVIDLE